MVKRIFVLMMFGLLFSSLTWAAQNTIVSTSPPDTVVVKKRIGYYEGGPWRDYQAIFKTMITRLAELGWIDKREFPQLPDNENTRILWHWLAKEVTSSFLEFHEDAYYSDGWDENNTKQTKKNLIARLNSVEDIDVMIAMGTHAGKILATNAHKIPTIVCSSSDPLKAGIIKSVDDSGYDHVTARIDPTNYKRQIEAFHDVIGFKRLGLTFSDTVAGRSYAGLEDVTAASAKRNFQIIECYTIDEVPDVDVSNKSLIACARELAPKIDAYYMTTQNGINQHSLPLILDVMNQYRVPTFVQHGSWMVKQGALMSVDDTRYSRTEGNFNAENLARMLNGAKPRHLNQINEEPVKIVFNKAAARLIDMDDDIYRLLSTVADEVYDTIQKPSIPTMATPVRQWRVGFLEGGPYNNYVESLKATVKALAAIGWLKVPPDYETMTDTRTLWSWLAKHTDSPYLLFQEKAYYSNDWDEVKRQVTKTSLLNRLKTARDIDLMIAMGTWAGLDLANNDHSVPTIVVSTSDPVRAGIVKSIEDSGYKHLVARMDPTRYQRQIRAFHDVIGFQKLGVAFSDTTEGRSYAAVDDIMAVAEERRFDMITCTSLGDVPDANQAQASVVNCAGNLAGKVDAFYITVQQGVTPQSLAGILEPLIKKGIPTFSQGGLEEVRQGVLMSVALAGPSLWGKFQAELIGRILNGAEPNELDPVFEQPVKIIFNAGTGLKIGLDPDTFKLLYETADVIIETKEAGQVHDTEK